MSLKFSPTFLTCNGKRVGVTYATGPWIAGVDPTTIKVRPRRTSRFSDEVRIAVAIENNSDTGTDYFESDCIRVAAGHPHYDAIKAAASDAGSR